MIIAKTARQSTDSRVGEGRRCGCSWSEVKDAGAVAARQTYGRRVWLPDDLMQQAWSLLAQIPDAGVPRVRRLTGAGAVAGPRN